MPHSPPFKTHHWLQMHGHLALVSKAKMIWHVDRDAIKCGEFSNTFSNWPTDYVFVNVSQGKRVNFITPLWQNKAPRLYKQGNGTYSRLVAISP